MVRPEFETRLKDTIEAGDIHLMRLEFARDKLEKYFPLTLDRYKQLMPEEISLSDQLVFRFTKLQDLMGRKLFRLILEGLGEEFENIAFIDILTKLEKLNILKDHQKWLELREIRNSLTHEYPVHPENYVSELNELYLHSRNLINIWKEVKSQAIKRFGI